MKGKERKPQCVETTAKGHRCPRPAKTGIEYCASHDPATAEARKARIAEMQAKSPLHDPALVEPADEVAAALVAFQNATGASWRSIARAADVPESYLGQVARGKLQNVSRERAARIRGVLDQRQAVAA